MKGLRRGGGAPPDERGRPANLAKRRLPTREAYRRLADHLSDAIVRYDAEKRPVYSNAACRRYLPAEAAPGVAAPFALLSRQDARAFAHRLDRVLKSGRSARLDVQLPAHAGDSGERIDLSISLHPATDAAGRVDGVFAVARDVSALRRAAEAAEMKAHELQSLFDLTPDVVICYDRDLRRTYCNPAAERLLPTPLRALGKRTEEGTTLPLPSEYARRLKGCLDHGASEEFEVSWSAEGGDAAPRPYPHDARVRCVGRRDRRAGGRARPHRSRRRAQESGISLRARPADWPPQPPALRPGTRSRDRRRRDNRRRVRAALSRHRRFQADQRQLRPPSRGPPVAGGGAPLGGMRRRRGSRVSPRRRRVRVAAARGRRTRDGARGDGADHRALRRALRPRRPRNLGHGEYRRRPLPARRLHRVRADELRRRRDVRRQAQRQEQSRILFLGDHRPHGGADAASPRPCTARSSATSSNCTTSRSST